MLLCVVIVFFICNFLPLIINTLETFNIGRNSIVIDQLIKTSNLLVTINSSVNFIIYVIFGEKFKRLFLILFCHDGKHPLTGRDSPDGGTHDDSFISNCDRHSLRLYRQSTIASRNGTSVRNGSMRDSWSFRSRTPTPSFCVYYHAGKKNNKEISAYTTQTSIPGPEWGKYSRRLNNSNRHDFCVQFSLLFLQC